MSKTTKKLREQLASQEALLKKYRRIAKIIDFHSYGKKSDQDAIKEIASVVYEWFPLCDLRQSQAMLEYPSQKKQQKEKKWATY